MGPPSGCPLSGRSVVVTRAPSQAHGLRNRLSRLGAGVVDVPVIRIEPVEPAAPLAVGDVDWIVFTSPNAVAQVEDVVRRASLDAGPTRIAAIGPGTAAALSRAGVTADLLPDRHVAEALVDVFPSGRGRVLLPQAEGARRVVAEGLRRKGWEVDEVVVYRTVPARPGAAELEAARAAHAITFTSPSTVTSFVSSAGVDGLPAVVVCIGPVTAAAARAAGVTVTAVADPHTIDGLVAAVVAALR